MIRRTIVALFLAAAIVAPTAAVARTPSAYTIAKRAVLARARVIIGSDSARLKAPMWPVGPNKWEAGVSAGGCDVFLNVTVVGRRARLVFAGKYCPPQDPPGSHE